MRHLVIGCGEVGKALMEVLHCDGYDPAKSDLASVDGDTRDMIHICFPYSDDFHKSVREYQNRHRPAWTVIHSTVPLGTSELLQAHHSPIRGKHPYLAESIRQFEKYVGGPNAEVVCNELKQYGITARPCLSARDTEAGKLIDLMQFGQTVLLEKAIHEFCKANNLDFDLVYTRFNNSYNNGYRAMGDHQFTRPVLEHMDGPIGGHCVAQNMKWLNMKEAEQIIAANEKLNRVKEPA